MIEIHLYGRLRKYAPQGEEYGSKSIIRLEGQESESLEMLLKRIGVEADDLYTIFVNSKLLTTHNSMARWLEYQQVCENCNAWNLDVVINDGDRIGLFGIDMAALVI